MAVTNKFTNPSFEDGFTGWTVLNTDSSRHEILLQQIPYDGVWGGVWGVNTRVEGGGGYCGVRQVVDLTGVHEISIQYKYALGTWGSESDFFVGIYIDGNLVKYAWDKIVGVWVGCVANISGYTGSHTVDFRHVSNTYNTNYNCTLAMDSALCLTTWAEPEASFGVSADSGTAPFTITCYNWSSGTPAPTYIWDFGDGSPTSSERNPTHTYTKSGQFTIQLTAVNPLGHSMFTRTVFVAGLPAVDFRPVPAGGGKNTIVTFKNLTTAYPPVTSWSWWFEGGQYPDTPDSTVFEPQHLYEDEGQYTVRLRGTNSVGTITATKVNCVTITPDLASRLAIHNVGVVIDGKLFRRGI
ncbi:MAG: PKD domain-containing protein [Methanoregulaceae archaeon]|nr:PKD domain-containing protein [Methanoregulaceae archaeon]